MSSLNLSHFEQPAAPATPKKFWNRNHATQRLAEELSRAANEARYEFSIVLIEFAGLSDITDRLGYAPADDVWRRVLGTLMEGLHPHDLCCRLGADEFILILPGKGARESQFVVDRLRRRWNPPAGSRESSIELSVGMASAPAHGSTIEALLSTADLGCQSDRLLNDQRPTELRNLPH